MVMEVLVVLDIVSVLSALLMQQPAGRRSLLYYHSASIALCEDAELNYKVGLIFLPEHSQ